MSLFFSVVVSTRNRASALSCVLCSLARQNYPHGDFEIIVVDNDSSDDGAKREVDFYKNYFPSLSIKYASEPVRGISPARNRGAREARGEILVFIDDDAEADKNWLSFLDRSWRAEPKAGAIGGSIAVIFPPGVNFPKWFGEPLYRWFGLREFEFDALAEISETRDFPYGGNISFRRDRFLACGGFKDAFGWGIRRKVAGEDCDLCLTLQRNGYRIFIEPRALVYHQTDGEKLRVRYLIRRGFSAGVTSDLMARLNPDMFRIERNPRAIIKRVLALIYRFFLDSRNLAERMDCITDISREAGLVWASLKDSKNASQD